MFNFDEIIKNTVQDKVIVKLKDKEKNNSSKKELEENLNKKKKNN